MKYIAMLFLTAAAALFAEGGFYRQYWAEFSPAVSNHADGRWRVNDPDIALHPEFGKRGEARANGLVLLDAPEDGFGIGKAFLYLEMWGGHPHTSGKRVSVNGKAVYAIPDPGVSAGHCVYSYPEIEIDPAHLVNGVNALQFSCERGSGFWGHFIMDQVALKCLLRTDSLIARNGGYAGFSARVEAPAFIDAESAVVVLDLPSLFNDLIAAVDFFAHYADFDDDGDGMDCDWHGYTSKRRFVHHLGRSENKPFRVRWNTEMIPDQAGPIFFKAVVQFTDGLFYETDPTPGTRLIRKKETVQMFYCHEAPVPFWSRDNQRMAGKIALPVDIGKILKAQLQVKIWDGGEGSIRDPFTINGHPCSITSKKAVHDVVHTLSPVDAAHLRSGENVFTLLSDTGHHGIEVLLPGPCLILRMKR